MGSGLAPPWAWCPPLIWFSLEEPLAWQLGRFPGPKPCLQGGHALCCSSGGQGARVQGLSLSFPWLSSGTELALLPHSQGFASTQIILGRDQGLLGICPRLFPWFLWEEIQRKTQSVPAEREGTG